MALHVRIPIDFTGHKCWLDFGLAEFGLGHYAPVGQGRGLGRLIGLFGRGIALAHRGNCFDGPERITSNG
jgi:hypothetical protein